MKNLFLILSACIIFSCNTKQDYETIFHNPDIYAQTAHQLNGVVMGNNFTPVVASRNYAYAAIAGYEVIAGAWPQQYQTLAGQLHGLKPLPQADTTKPADYYFAALLAYCKVGQAVTFPEGSMQQYVDSMKQLALDHGMSKEMLANTVAYADTIGSSIMAWAKKDNYAQTRSGTKFTVIDTPGRWVPTPPAYAQAAEPHWNEIRSMVMDSADEFLPPPPPKFDIKNKNSEYYKNVMMVKNAGDSLTPEQKQVADFWDDNPFKLNVVGHVQYATKKFSPPGHWMNIVGIIAQKQHADFSETVCAYTKTGIALFDGFISCWDEKYRSNYVRPETVINKYISPEWQPYIQTPPFPEYTSGHAVISAAAAEVITSIFGDNVPYTDSSELEFGIPNRSFTSVKEAAEEASISRVYGGIHYKYSCEAGAAEGKLVGALVNQRLQMKKK